MGWQPVIMPVIYVLTKSFIGNGSRTTMHQCKVCVYTTLASARLVPPSPAVRSLFSPPFHSIPSSSSSSNPLRLRWKWLSCLLRDSTRVSRQFQSITRGNRATTVADYCQQIVDDRVMNDLSSFAIRSSKRLTNPSPKFRYSSTERGHSHSRWAAVVGKQDNFRQIFTEDRTFFPLSAKVSSDFIDSRGFQLSDLLLEVSSELSSAERTTENEKIVESCSDRVKVKSTRV